MIEGKSAEDEDSGFWWIKHHSHPNHKEQGESGSLGLSLGHIPHLVEISRFLLPVKKLETVLPAECSEPSNCSLFLLKSLCWLYGFYPRLSGTSKKA